MDFLRQDLRLAVRQLLKSPGFTLTAVLTLALGIGATTAIFSIVAGVLMRPLPFPDPASLVGLGDILEGVNYDGFAPGVTAPGARIYMRETHGFAALGAYQQSAYEFSGPGGPAQINGARLSASVFEALGVSPLMGRAFSAEEDEGGQQVAVLSYQSWRSRFHGGEHILGQKILLDRKPYVIIGVMPREFEFPLVAGQLNRSELWVPMSFSPTELSPRSAGAWTFNMVGRLKPGVTAAQAQQDATTAAAEIMRNFPPALSSRRIHPQVQSLSEITIGQARPLVRTLFLAVIVVLFIASANLAGLLLVRVLGRRREISVRLALGAGRAAVLRQLLVESLLLSTAGGLAGLAAAWGALRVGVSFLPETLPRVSSIKLDWKVAAFALALSLLTGLLCGLIPAFAAARTAVNESLKEGGRTGTAGRGHARVRSFLVVAELAVALVLLTASGLLLRSFEKMRAVDLGFQPDHTLTASYSLPKQQYSDQTSVDAFNLALRSKLEQLPGVEAVGFTSILPAAGNQFQATFTPKGYTTPKGEGLHIAWVPTVWGDYFDAQGIRLVRGRAFTPADDANAQLVTIINRPLAEHYWPGQNPIGKRLHRGPKEADLPWLTVIGEIEGVKSVAADLPTSEQFYIPSAQAKADAGSFASPNFIAGNTGSLVVRGKLAPEALTDSLLNTVRSLDPQLPLTQVESMDRVVGEGQASRRFDTALISAFAAAAVLLAILGIYSVTAFSTMQRSQEMAIRMALGSQRAQILRLVLGSGLKLGLVGSAIGAIAAIFATRLLRTLLFEVDPVDPVVIVLAACAILVLALVAALIPARRAASINPVEALRAD